MLIAFLSRALLLISGRVLRSFLSPPTSAKDFAKRGRLAGARSRLSSSLSPALVRPSLADGSRACTSLFVYVCFRGVRLCLVLLSDKLLALSEVMRKRITRYRFPIMALIESKMQTSHRARLCCGFHARPRRPSRFATPRPLRDLVPLALARRDLALLRAGWRCRLRSPRASRAGLSFIGRLCARGRVA